MVSLPLGIDDLCVYRIFRENEPRYYSLFFFLSSLVRSAPQNAAVIQQVSNLQATAIRDSDNGRKYLLPFLYYSHSLYCGTRSPED